MNILLYRTIKLCAKRQIPSIEKQRKTRPLRELLFQYLRIFIPLSQYPLWIDFNHRIFLSGSIAVNSKSGQVYSELVACGIPSQWIWYINITPYNGIIHIFRLVARLPWCCLFLLQNAKRLSGLSLVAIEVVIGYAAYRRFFNTNKEIIPVIISDLSPTFLMQWAAALAVGNKVMWWQDDYHHYQGFSDENYFPFQSYYASVLNNWGHQTVISKNVKYIYVRRNINIKPFRPIPNNPIIGFASNVLFATNSEQLNLLNQIRIKLNADIIYCRLHPNSKLHGNKSNPTWLEFAPKNETLEDFAEKVDLTIVGNSAVQLKLLCLGIPVTHVSGFDDFGFDLYKYCRLGISYGTENIESFDLEEVRGFYTNNDLQSKINKYVNTVIQLPTLESFRNTITN